MTLHQGIDTYMLSRVLATVSRKQKPEVIITRVVLRCQEPTIALQCPICIVHISAFSKTCEHKYQA